MPEGALRHGQGLTLLCCLPSQRRGEKLGEFVCFPPCLLGSPERPGCALCFCATCRRGRPALAERGGAGAGAAGSDGAQGLLQGHPPFSSCSSPLRQLSQNCLGTFSVGVGKAYSETDCGYKWCWLLENNPLVTLETPETHLVFRSSAPCAGLMAALIWCEETQVLPGPIWQQGFPRHPWSQGAFRATGMQPSIMGASRGMARRWDQHCSVLPKEDARPISTYSALSSPPGFFSAAAGNCAGTHHPLLPSCCQVPKELSCGHPMVTLQCPGGDREHPAVCSERWLQGTRGCFGSYLLFCSLLQLLCALSPAIPMAPKGKVW